MTDRPTTPPTAADAKADAFAARLAELERREPRSPASGVWRAIAHAWAETTQDREP